MEHCSVKQLEKGSSSQSGGKKNTNKRRLIPRRLENKKEEKKKEEENLHKHKHKNSGDFGLFLTASQTFITWQDAACSF